MPSAASVILRGQLKLFKPAITGMSIEKMRSSHDKLGDLMAKAMHSRVTYTDMEIEHIPASFVSPNGEKASSGVILYLHGGAYVAGNLKYARGFAGVLASTLSMDVLCIAYRLAPENPYPAALDDAYSAYLHLTDRGYAPEDITLVGESAGGGLLLALTLKLKAQGMPLPGKLVPISPWTDLTLSGASYKTNEKRDPTLSCPHLYDYVSMYSGGNERDPYVSPLLGDLSGFPPTLMFAGGDELLLDDAVSLHERLYSQGVNSSLIVEEGMWHAYVLYGVPEAKLAMQKIKDFVLKDNIQYETD